MSDVQGFFAAIRAGDAGKVKAMLAEDPPLAEAKNEQGQSAVLAAVYSGRIDGARFSDCAWGWAASGISRGGCGGADGARRAFCG